MILGSFCLEAGNLSAHDAVWKGKLGKDLGFPADRNSMRNVFTFWRESLSDAEHDLNALKK